MPTYDYQCKKCGFTEEVSQKISESPLTNCPSCHSDSFQRLISGGNALLFKGSGFYITDYCNKESSSNEKSSSCGCTGKHSCE